MWLGGQQENYINITKVLILTILDGASARTTLLSFDFSKILQPKILNGVMCIRQIINLNPWMAILIQATICLKIEQKELHNPRFKVKLG
jgi:hypothetical protein